MFSVKREKLRFSAMSDRTGRKRRTLKHEIDAGVPKGKRENLRGFFEGESSATVTSTKSSRARGSRIRGETGPGGT